MDSKIISCLEFSLCLNVNKTYLVTLARDNQEYASIGKISFMHDLSLMANEDNIKMQTN